MPNTAGGPFGGLANSPELWSRLLNSMGTIGRFLGESPDTTGVGRNALRDALQIGVTAPLGVPGGVGMTMLSEAGRPPWEQSFVQGPLRGLKMTSDLARIAFQHPEMLQKLSTAAHLAAPGVVQQAFREHPVLTPLMAIPILPGGKRFGMDDEAFFAKWGKDWQNLHAEGQKRGLNPHDAMKWASSQLENALNRITQREKRIKRKLAAHEVEDVIQQAMSERPPASPGATAPPEPVQPVGPTREEMLHLFEEGPGGPLPPEARIASSTFGAPSYERTMAERSSADLFQGMSDYHNDIARVLNQNQLPSIAYAKALLGFIDEAGRRGLKIPNNILGRDVLLNIIKARSGQEGVKPLPPGIFTSPEQIGGQMLTNEVGTSGDLGLAGPVHEQRPADFMDVLHTAITGGQEAWQSVVRRRLDQEWSRNPKTGPFAGPIDVNYGTGFLNRYAGDQPVGTRFSHKGQDFIRLKRGWSIVPKSEEAAAGESMLRGVNLREQSQNWHQKVVENLNSSNPRGTEHWEGGQHFVRGPRGWMLDPHMFIPPIQKIGNQTIFPRPEGSIYRFVGEVFKKRLVTDGKYYNSVEKKWKDAGTSQGNLSGAYNDLVKITGSKEIAQFWLMDHIFQRRVQGKATPAEVVWFELQKQRPPDEGMAGASR